MRDSRLVFQVYKCQRFGCVQAASTRNKRPCCFGTIQRPVGTRRSLNLKLPKMTDGGSLSAAPPLPGLDGVTQLLQGLA